MALRSHQLFFIASALILLLSPVLWYGDDFVADWCAREYFTMTFIDIDKEHARALVTAFENSKAATGFKSDLFVRSKVSSSSDSEKIHFVLYARDPAPPVASDHAKTLAQSIDAEFTRRDLPALNNSSPTSPIPLRPFWAEPFQIACQALSWVFALFSVILLAIGWRRQMKELPPPLGKEIAQSRYDY